MYIYIYIYICGMLVHIQFYDCIFLCGSTGSACGGAPKGTATPKGRRASMKQVIDFSLM